jgi:hypothetical protein
MKYIIFEDFSGKPQPIIFPEKIMHSEIREQLPYSTVLSGGYVDFSAGVFICHGEAEELEVKAGEKDAAVIMDAFSGGSAQS